MRKHDNAIPQSVAHLHSEKKPVTWVLIAQRGKAKLLEQKDDSKIFTHIKGFIDPSGEMQPKELDSDRPGRVDRVSGPGSHAVSSKNDSHEQSLIRFSREVAQFIESGFVKGDCQRLIICAEPHCLGRFKEQLGKNSSHHLAVTVTKDLFLLDESELWRELEEQN